MTDIVKLITDHIYQVRMPLPFALNSVNLYLIDGEDGWTILDTGLHTEEGEAVWKAVFETLTIAPTDIAQIVVTHMHPDHYGMAGWLYEQCVIVGNLPPVYMSAYDSEAVRRTWIKRGEGGAAMGNYMRCRGIAESDIAPILAVGDAMALRTAPHPPITILHPGDIIIMGGRTFQTLAAPGHCDGQLIFYDADDGLMFSGDQVLMKITPNVGRWHDSARGVLARFLDSLESLRDLEIRLALPGHKTPIEDWRGRIDALIAHHAERLEAVRHVVHAAGAGATVNIVAAGLFNMERLTVHERRFALAETLAHLEHLEEARVLQRETVGGVWRFDDA